MSGLRNVCAVATTSLLALFAAGCNSSNNVINFPQAERVFGSGVVIEEIRSVSGFSAITHAGLGSVHIEFGATEGLRVEADDNLLQHIETFVQSGVLTIRVQDGFELEPTQTIEYHVTLVSLDRVTLSGVGDVDMSGFDLSDLTLILTGVGNIEFTGLLVDQLNLTLTGVGDIEVSGTATSQTVTLTGVGDVEGENLLSVSADVTVSGVGSATVNVSTTLNATVTGPGSIFYIGDPPNLQISVTGPGQVMKIG